MAYIYIFKIGVVDDRRCLQRGWDFRQSSAGRPCCCAARSRSRRQRRYSSRNVARFQRVDLVYSSSELTVSWNMKQLYRSYWSSSIHSQTAVPLCHWDVNNMFTLHILALRLWFQQWRTMF